MHLNVMFSNESDLKNFQDFLYKKSNEGKSFTGLLEAMIHEVTIVTAVHNIKSNKGSKTAGIDKISIDRYLQMEKDELLALIQSNFKQYKPKPAKRVYIPKSNNKSRPLGIPTMLDRIIQECMKLILEPICEARFYPHSYGFRPYRAQKHAIRDIVNVINSTGQTKDKAVWAVEGDIKGCFDNINHRILMCKLWKIDIHDKRVLKMISQMLKAGYIESGLYYMTETGTPQGSIISPLLANVYLNDFDWYVGRKYFEPHRQCKHKANDTRRMKANGATPKYNFRFADDWVILTSSKDEAERLKHELTKYFMHKLKLEYCLCNLPHRHESYQSTTFAVQVEGNWFGLTYAFITHSRHESKPFDQKITPYTADGRKRYLQRCIKNKRLPCDRPSINSPEDIAFSIYRKGKDWKMNFEYYMNREYAYNRDKGKCKCCGKILNGGIIGHCHHVDNKLPIDKINKVLNLAWVCMDCHHMIHNSPLVNVDVKTEKKIRKYREKLKK